MFNFIQLGIDNDPIQSQFTIRRLVDGLTAMREMTERHIQEMKLEADADIEAYRKRIRQETREMEEVFSRSLERFEARVRVEAMKEFLAFLKLQNERGPKKTDVLMLVRTKDGLTIRRYRDLTNRGTFKESLKRKKIIYSDDGKVKVLLSFNMSSFTIYSYDMLALLTEDKWTQQSIIRESPFIIEVPLGELSSRDIKNLIKRINVQVGKGSREVCISADEWEELFGAHFEIPKHSIACLSHKFYRKGKEISGEVASYGSEIPGNQTDYFHLYGMKLLSGEWILYSTYHRTRSVGLDIRKSEVIGVVPNRRDEVQLNKKTKQYAIEGLRAASQEEVDELKRYGDTKF